MITIKTLFLALFIVVIVAIFIYIRFQYKPQKSDSRIAPSLYLAMSKAPDITAVDFYQIEANKRGISRNEVKRQLFRELYGGIGNDDK